MAAKTVSHLQALMDLAEVQGGLFSAAQATDQSVSRTELARLLQGGYLERETWGVYRMSTWPLSPHASFWRALLWAQVGGLHSRPVISHRSALMLHAASLDNPPKIDVTLPRAKRRITRRQPPPAVRLHFRDLDESEITKVDGLPATTVFRSIVDLLIDREASDAVAYVMAHGVKDGKLSEPEFNRLLPLYDLDPALLDRVLAEARSK